LKDKLIAKISNTSQKILRLLIKLVFYFLVILILLITLIYVPPIQSFVARKAEKTLSSRLNGEVQIGKLNLNLFGNLILKDIYVKETTGFKVFQAQKIDLKISLLPILYGTIHVDHLKIEGLKFNLEINKDSSTTNLDFIIQAFSGTQPEKKTESKSWDITVDEISIVKSFFLLNIYRQLKLIVDIGKAELLDDNSDILNLDFKTNEINLHDIDVSLTLLNDSTPINQVENDSESTIKSNSKNVISEVDRIDASNINFDLNIYDQFQLTTEVPKFSSRSIYFNLDDKIINTSELSLINSIVEIINYDSNDRTTTDSSTIANTKDLFIENFQWSIGSNEAILNNCALKYDNEVIPDTSQTIDINHLQLERINVSLKNALLANQHLQGKLNEVSLKEKTGFNLQDLTGRVYYKNDSLTLETLEIKTDNSLLQADIFLYGGQSENILQNPKPIKFNIDIPELIIDAKDLDFFMDNNLLTQQNIYHLQLSTRSHGQLTDFRIEEFELNIDDVITGTIEGELKNLLHPEAICAENIMVKFNVKKNIILDSLKTYNINLPDELTLTGQIDGCASHMIASGQLQSSFGDLVFSADYKNPNQNSRDTLSFVINSNGLELDKVFKNEILGQVFVSNEGHITGLNMDRQSYKLKSIIDSIYLNQKIIRNINLTAAYNEWNIDLLIDSKDSLMNMLLNGKGIIQDSLIAIQADVNLKNIDLGHLGIEEKPFKLSGNLSTTELIGNQYFDISVDITDLNIVTKKTFTFDTINIDLFKNADSTLFDLHSDFIIGQFSSNIPIYELDNRIAQFYKYHFIGRDSIPDPKNLGYLKFDFKSEKTFENLVLLVPGLNEFQFSSLEGEINESQGTSNVDISIPHIAYQNINFDSVYFNMSSLPEQLNYKFGIPNISNEAINLQNLKLTGFTESGTVNNTIFLQNASADTLVRAGFIISQAEDDQFTIQIDPGSLILNSKQWDVRGKNEISFYKNKNIFGNINIADNQQSLFIDARDTLYNIDIVNFQLANFSKLLQSINPDFEMSGELNMHSNILVTDVDLLVNSKISISDLIMQETHFGNINIEIGNDHEYNLVGMLDLINGNNKLHLEANYYQNATSNPLNAKAEIQFNEMSEFRSFANKMITNPSGKIQGSFSIVGDKENFTTNGELDFQSVELLFKPVNNTYKIENEKIIIENNRLLLKDFTLLDSADNSFEINGSVKTEHYDQYELDINLNADRFTVYNARHSDNPNFFGTLILSMDAKIKGAVDNPNILVDLSIEDGSDLVYALPPKDFDLVDSEGIVEFVNLSEVDTVQELRFQQYVGDTIFSKLNWIDLNAILKIDKAAQFTIDMDPISGDYLQFGGNGNLNLIVQKNQNPQITGNYEFDRGIYQVSFYGLVKKTFEFEPGSNIAWSGDPYNALLNLKAKYNIRTASVGLVSKEIYGLSDDEKSQYRKTLPYSVEINIKGQLDKPKIGFGIDLPEEEKSGFPLVETKLNQLSEPGNESELTRQVFGLLTIGSFIPETTGPGSSSDYGSALATTAAANSLNAILTNEMNKLSGKYIKFADLDIGMQTYSDMVGGTQTNRTTMDIRLSKKLFNDRVTIEAQSSFDVYNETDKYKHASDQSNVYSDFAIIYDLREKGDYKLKAFEKSAYDIIYKDTRMGGVAVIFIKEFDRYKKERKSK